MIVVPFLDYFSLDFTLQSSLSVMKACSTPSARVGYSFARAQYGVVAQAVRTVVASNSASTVYYFPVLRLPPPASSIQLQITGRNATGQLQTLTPRNPFDSYSTSVVVTSVRDDCNVSSLSFVVQLDPFFVSAQAPMVEIRWAFLYRNVGLSDTALQLLASNTTVNLTLPTDWRTHAGAMMLTVQIGGPRLLVGGSLQSLPCNTTNGRICYTFPRLSYQFELQVIGLYLTRMDVTPAPDGIIRPFMSGDQCTLYSSFHWSCPNILYV